MVYYVDDKTDKEWSVVVHLKPRDLFEMGEVDEEDRYENEPYQQQEFGQFFDDNYENIQIAIDENVLIFYGFDILNCQHAKVQAFIEKKNSDQLVSDSQGAESTHSFLQSTSCLPPHHTTSFLATTHSVTLFQSTLQAPPIFQPVSQSSQSVDSTSHSTTMDQLMPQHAPTTYPTSQPSHLVHSTSHPTSTEQDSSQQVPTVQAPFKKCIGRESQSYWTVEAIDSENNVKRLKVRKTDMLNLSGDELIVVNFDYLNEPFGEAKFSFKTTESNARQHIVEMAETGQRPGRAQIYIATHKNKDGVYVNEATKETV
ncbi:hypothetical protein H5410_064211 [Solanum commersonii]|uniref:DUF4216 domain-containing protein n=1 Tax=Solanum commersonii TaxID=4109 RepID=A0A9J5W0S7_SOLCO|nr:hypothetical protein H5410_064211 [Solanum commersonii]